MVETFGLKTRSGLTFTADAAGPTGGVLVIPANATAYSVDITGGESAAITIDRAMTVVIDGTIKTIGGAIQANPPTCWQRVCP